MKKAFLILTIVGVILLVAGGAVFAIAMSKSGWDFSALSETECSTDSATFSAAEIQEIVVEVGTADVSFLPAEDDRITVEYYTVQDKNGKVLRKTEPVVEGGALRCIEEKTKRSFTIFGIKEDAKLVLKVPADRERKVSLKVSTGDVVFGKEGRERSVSSLRIESSTGDVALVGKTTCRNDLSVQTSTGSVTVKGAIECGGDVDVRTSTGKVKVSATVSAKTIMAHTSTGDVVASAPLTCDALSVQTSTGDVSVCVAGTREAYAYTYETSTGKSNVASFVGGEKTILIKTSTGDIDLTFAG